MEYLVKDEQLELKYEPGKGAWTYHILIPNTKHIVGRWGFLKASGTIDGYEVVAKNLFTIKGQDKKLSVNEAIRKTINKSGGDMVNVTLYLLNPKELITEKQIVETFKEAGVLAQFEQLSADEKEGILANIMSQKNEEKQIDVIVKQIDAWMI